MMYLQDNSFLYDCLLTLPLFFIYGFLWKKFFGRYENSLPIEGIKSFRLPGAGKFQRPTVKELAKCTVIALGITGTSTLWFVLVDTVLIKFPFWSISVEKFDGAFPSASGINGVFMVISVVLLGAVVEELLFRGLVFSSLEKIKSGWFPIVGSAILFGLFHGEAVQVVYAAFMGLVVALVYSRTKRLDLAISIHVINNLISVLNPLIKNAATGKIMDVVLVLMIIPMALLLIKDRTTERKITAKAISFALIAVITTGILSSGAIYAMTPTDQMDYEDAKKARKENTKDLPAVPFKIANMKISGKIKAVDIKKKQITMEGTNDVSKQKFNATIKLSSATIFYDLATSKTYKTKSLKKGEYITIWVSVYEDDSAKNLTVDGYAIFKNAEKNDSPDKLPSLIKIKKIEKQKDKIKIKDDSEFSWIIPKNATIKLLNGKTAGPRDLKKGQRCLGYIDSKKSTRTKETEVVTSKLLIVK